MSDLPLATQTYKPENKLQNRIVRQAQCPLHSKPNKKSEMTGAPGIFRATQMGLLDGKEYWAFACHHYGPKREHIFLAIPDKTAPTTTDGVQSWIKRQEQLKLQKASKQQ